MLLDELAIGQKALVKNVNYISDITERLVAMGIVKGVTVELLRKAPLGDPLEIKIRNFLLSLRRAEAMAIEVEALS